MKEAEDIGVQVEYWDISALFFSNFEMEDSSFLSNTRKFSSYKELEGAIVAEQPLSNILFISIMTFEARVGKLYYIFTKYNCKLAVFGRNMFPTVSSPGRTRFRQIFRVTLPKLINFLKELKIKQERRSGKIKGYDILFLGGSMGWKGIGNIDYNDIDKTEVVKVNSDDYDVFLGLRDAKPIVNHDYILFLDEYLPLHPDTDLFGIKNITPQQYYPDLCNFFERIEKQFGIPVIIAAHPKALKYKENDFFERREVHFGKSAELSKHAFFVIAHDSTSINFPIAFNKKIHFITSSNIQNGINSVHRNVIHFADFLGCNYQWFDKSGDINIVDEIPKEKYRNYKYDFQTWPETENILTKDIFIKFLKGGLE